MAIFYRFSFLFIYIFLIFFINANEIETFHQYTGDHLIANYLDCDEESLNNTKELKEVMKKAAEDAGATVLEVSEKHFSPSGYSAIILLSESHASIHTYPEYNACFIDFFTCGSSCSPRKFHENLIKYLQPKKVVKKIFIRDEQILEKIN